MKSHSLIWIMAGVLLLCLCVSSVSADGSIHVTSIPQGAKIGLNMGGEDSTEYSYRCYHSWFRQMDPIRLNSILAVTSLHRVRHMSMREKLRKWLSARSPGTLVVTSNPSGAIVYIDDIEQYNPTPGTYYGITPGYHKVQAAQNYQSQTYICLHKCRTQYAEFRSD